MRTGVVIAVEKEAEAILADKSFSWTQTGENLYRSKTQPVDLAVSGVGKVLASYALTRLASLPPVPGDSVDAAAHGGFPLHDLYCALGTSGSLGSEAVGSMYLCAESVERDMDTSGIGTPPGITAFEPMGNAVMRTCPQKLAAAVTQSCKDAGITLRPGRSLSGDSFVSSAEASAALCLRFGQESPGALLVDMETAALAKLCLLRIRRPFFAVRWVSDNADHAASGSWEANVSRSSVDVLGVLKAILVGG